MSANDLRGALPHSLEAEQSVIGALLIDNDAIDRIGDLRAAHFYRGDHRTIFAQTVRMIARGVGADAITVYERLQAQGRADAVGGLRYLNELAQSTPSAANIARYADIVRDRAQKRGLLAVAAEIQESIGTPEAASALIDRAAARLDRLGDATTNSEPLLAAQGLANHISVLERRSAGKEQVITTGLEDVDRQLNGGLRAGWLVILAARPGMGKTALALNIASHVAQEHSVLFLSMEMPASELHDRNLASLGRIELDTVMRAPEGDVEFWNRVTVAAQKITDLKLYIDDQAALRLLDVRAKARLIKRKSGLDVIVVDYLQLMTGEGANRNAEIEGISRGLKALAKELNVAIIALAQLNRKVEERSARLPVLSDLRDSGSIEQDADAVLFVHREEVANPDCGDQVFGFAQLRFAKFRHGRTGDVALTYRGKYMTFENHIGPWPTACVKKSSRSRGFE